MKNIIFFKNIYKKLPKKIQRKAGCMANQYMDIYAREGSVGYKDMIRIIKNGGRIKRVKPVLNFTDKTIEVVQKNECYGCGACMNICPVDAIRMKPDMEGFLYPHIDRDKCIECGKCQKHCPSLQTEYVNTEEPECYAVMADESIRMQSSSGGMFTILANYILEKGGFVCGAAYNEEFITEHILIQKSEELYKLRGSKYVQSDTKIVYKEIKEALDKQIPVLFTGCPCQVAGLTSYLNKEYDNLLTADLVCHGVPSPKTFCKYLNDKYGDEKIERINFREKKTFGWSMNMNVFFENGDRHLERAGTNSYLRAFSSCIGNRPSCSSCQFSKIPRQADFSLGDFWGIGKIKPEMSDGKGTSLVLVNSKKGQEIFGCLKEKINKMERMTLDEARSNNYGIDHSFKMHPSHSRFFELQNIYTFDKAVDYALKKKFDIGVIGLWYGRNYGSMITYYSLYKALSSMGLSVLMIDNPLTGKNEVLTKTHPKRFAKEYYNISQVYSLGEVWKLNDVCDTFLVGSDQLWNFWLSRPYGHYYFLSFVNENNKKIAYGTSFGSDQYKGSEGYKMVARQNMQRFDHVSVREDFAVDMCRDIFGVESTMVIDPVFFCRDTDYAAIERPRTECTGDYILAYILDPYKEKTEALIHVAERLNMPVKVILDEVPTKFEENRKRMEIPEGAPIEILEEVEIREWLYSFHHSQYVITDSFHGTCFAVIFKKKFTAMSNPNRGSKRFTSLLKRFHLTDRLTENAKSVIDHPMISQEIDYDMAYSYIDAEVEKSRAWLKNAIFSPKKVKSYSAYPIIDKRISDLKE